MIDPTGREAVRRWLATGEPLEFEVLTGSMWPLVRQGDRVRVEKLTSSPRLADVVLVELVDRWVVHRVRRVGSRLTTKGDSAFGFDPPVERERVTGLVTSVRRDDLWYDLPAYPLNLVLAALAICAVALRVRAAQIARTVRSLPTVRAWSSSDRA